MVVCVVVSGKVGFDAIVADTPEVVTKPSVLSGSVGLPVGCPLVVCTWPLEPGPVLEPALAEPATSLPPHAGTIHVAATSTPTRATKF